MKIPFNKPFFAGRELEYIRQAVLSGKISGGGLFTKKCHEFFQQRFGFDKCLLTTSCTDALEMAALLIDIQPDDEVIMPSYTFVSTANAFVLRGAKIVFADSHTNYPCMNEDLIEDLITSKTRAIVPVHYAGVCSDMDKIMKIAKDHGLYVVEDAAQAIDSFYTGADGKRKPLGSIGDLGAFSFHETKNIISGEGGMLAINNPQFEKRSEIIWEKGTNRSAFWRGEVDKYGWVDVGSSFLPSEIVAAFLFGQLENLDLIQSRRKELWNYYLMKLKPLEDVGYFKLPHIPSFGSNNAHMFYVVCNSAEDRTGLINLLKEHGIMAVFHYLSLHKSPFYETRHDGRELIHSDIYSDRLVRLPLYFDLRIEEIEAIANLIIGFYEGKG